MVKIEYLNQDKGYVGKSRAKPGILKFPKVGSYEVHEKDAQYLVKTFLDWFAYADQESQMPLGSNSEQGDPGNQI